MSTTTETHDDWKQVANQVSTQRELERLFSKNQLMPRMRSEFLNAPEFDFRAYLESKNIHVEFGIDLMVQMALHKRAKLPVLIGLLRHYLDDSQATADMLLKCVEADLVDYHEGQGIFIVKFLVSQDVQDEIDRYQFPLPMIIEPLPVETNRDTGYYENRGSIILKHNHHEGDVCLDHINRMNQVKLTLNTEVVRMIQNRWKNLDSPKEGESREEYETRVRAFEKYDRVARDIIEMYSKHLPHFYLTHRYDKRGRTYCQGYHVTYQGNPWNKACIEFAEKELVE